MGEPTKFRKKPVVIEAIRLTAENAQQVCDWIIAGGGGAARSGVGPYIQIRTLEGTMSGDHGDWVIRGVAGEFYPCKPDIFAATYEAAVPTKETEHG